MFSELVGESDGASSEGSSTGGAGGEAATGDGSFLGDGDLVGVGDRDLADGVGVGVLTGSGAGDGDFPKSSMGRRTLSTLNTTRGVSSTTVSATLDGPTPV